MTGEEALERLQILRELVKATNQRLDQTGGEIDDYVYFLEDVEMIVSGKPIEVVVSDESKRGELN